MTAGDLGQAVRDALYLVIEKRRDIRLFRAGLPIPDDVLLRILDAAHHAPSVGYSQPWDFLVLRDLGRRARIRESFLRCRAAEAARYPAPRREQYLAYRLEGILDSSLNLCVTVDLRPTDEQTLGTIAQPEALRWSACCAVQNLWLAARAEGVGVGWVSIVEPAVLRAELELPAGIEPVAYLCIGYPVEFRDRPMLEENGWRGRRELAAAIHQETYPRQPAPQPPPGVKPPPSPPGLDLAARDRALAHHARLCKPAGSLGRLEQLGAWYAGARGHFPVESPEKARLYVMAADHGVVAEGVSAYSSSVTAAMIGNFLVGGAAVSSLAASCGVEVVVVDAGVAGDLSSLPQESERKAKLVRAPVRAGSGNLRIAPAMSRAEAEQAIALGEKLAHQAADDGVQLLCGGDMGIGNTTCAAALLCAYAEVPPEEAVGAGTGVDEPTRARKIAVVRDALALHLADRPSRLDVLARLGGLELAALAGLYIGAASRRIPVVVDGFPAAAAALAAVRLHPSVRDHLLLSHRSAERGATRLSAALELEPLLDLGLRLGEGTGAVLGAHLVRTAVRLMREMATFSTAGIAGRAPRID